MTDATDTPHQAVLNLLTGHFHETSGYRAIRRQGVGDWLLIHTVDGRGRFGHPDGDLIAEAGDWVLLRPGTPHDYGVETSLQRWDLVWAHFQPRTDWLAWLNWPVVADGLMRLHVEDDALGAQFRSVHGLLGSQRMRREALAMNALEALLLGLDEHNVDGQTRQGDQRVHEAMAFLDGHLAEKLLIDDVADAVGLSPSRLAHLFKDQTGQTVQGYLEARRMQVAAAAGFESQFYFSQRFSKWTGLSPVVFRRTQDRD